MTWAVTALFRAKTAASLGADEDPFSGELLSLERLEERAEKLAATDRTFVGSGRRQSLLARLSDNETKLNFAYRTLSGAVRRERTISPAAEWLVDNFHIVEEQLREIREDLPVGYYRLLPKLAAGELSEYPRIYGLAIALISHTDCRLDLEILKRFVRAYQRVAPLSIGELWAVAITLRLALVENLARLSVFIVNSRDQRDRANLLADQLLEKMESAPEDLLSHFRKQLGSNLNSTFVSQLTRRLRNQHTTISGVLAYLDQQLIQRGKGTNELVQLEHGRQVATQATVANIITSMRLLSTIDWRDFFESVSLIDPLLKSDPAGAYLQMDFATRDRYRGVIEQLSRRTGLDELEIGRCALRLAGRQLKTKVEAHVGYYFVDKGRPDLELAVGYHPRIGEHLTRFVLFHATLCYLGSIACITALFAGSLGFYAHRYGARGSLIAAILLLSVIPVSDLAINFVNWTVTSFFKPQSLPKMDASQGISDEARTIIVVPTMLADAPTIDALLERLEVHYLSNQDEQLHFALLTDFVDAPQETMADDEMLLDQARSGIARLNQRYRSGGQSHFHIFHRRRQYNQSEGKWMGWERKRGKLHEFNRLLRGAQDTSFIMATAVPAELAKVRYVITLDSDTRLPHDTARRLIETITHPLNRPRFDATLRRVTRGYSLIQPRVSISLESASRSWFTRIFSGNTGVDPYTTAVSDVYQDLFSEGIYTGKGLYDVDSFEAAMAERVPENSLLSHDLFEGLFTRTALATDIELFDDYPTQYDVYARRQHRWTRGDWQVAAMHWFAPAKRPGPNVISRLPLISSWKIVDNLRRSLFAPTVLLWLIAVWTITPGSALVWTMFVLMTLTFPVYADLIRTFFVEQRGSWSSRFHGAVDDLRLHTLQALLNITFCSHQAYLMADAIGRTLYRKIISRRRLLEWVTAAQDHRASARNFSDFLRFMSAAPVIALLIGALVLLLRPESISLAGPFLLLWLLSPLVAHVVSRRVSAKIETLRAEDTAYARLIARRTWRFFETLIGEANHWLPPDNYQEDPHSIVARRTSPTNIGLSLLSTVAAHDFGYLGTLELVERLELTMTALEKLPRFRGHFFNWYDTATLEPLPPRYVSTVDSGNLAGHLLVIKQACNELPDCPLFNKRAAQGLADTLRLLIDELQTIGGRRQSTEAITVNQLRSELEICVRLVTSDTHRDFGEWSNLLYELMNHLMLVQDIVSALAQEHGPQQFNQLRSWIGTAIHQTDVFTRDLQILTPWTTEVAKILSSVDRFPPAISDQVRIIAEDLGSIEDTTGILGRYDNALLQLAALRRMLEGHIGSAEPSAVLDSIDLVTKAVERAISANESLRARTKSLAHLCDLLVDEVDFDFLFDRRLKVLTIGYNIEEGKRDNSFYDLFASEARLASFVAIATGDVPQEHWFRLGRQLTSFHGERALISWSATMFEYLMPLLVMRQYGETLLAETYRTVVNRQIEYGKEHEVPWGISESAYNARSLDLTYQYAAFGVPGLGLKRGLSENLVVAPYATLLAAMLRPREALVNLRRLERRGALGRFGFYDALDFTPDRLPPHQRQAIVHTFMTHHQGMSLVALDNLLHGDVMQNRFHTDPLVRANELLLQERVSPAALLMRPRAEEVLTSRIWKRSAQVRIARHYSLSEGTRPRLHLLSNGTYSVMLTTSGAGYSSCGPFAVTRWREDGTRDNWGSFFYLRDVGSGAVWSVGYQPMLRTPQTYEVSFSEDRVTILRQDVGITTQTEIIVSPEDNAELRRISLTNHSTRVREIELTSYAEVVLSAQSSDVAHPAFGNLFIETEFVSEKDSLLARRRPRSEAEKSIWAIHTMVAEGDTTVTEGEWFGGTQYETDRNRFLGRGRTTAEPVAVIEDRLLSNSVGAPLDPIFSLRRRLRLAPKATIRVCFTTAVATSRDEALSLADKYHDLRIFERQARLAWTKSQVELRYLDIDQEQAQLFQELAARIIYSDPELRPRPHVLALNTKPQESLWRYGISGDLPILLVRIREASDLSIVNQLLRAHEFLRLKGLKVDLLILNDQEAGYMQHLQDELLELVRKSKAQSLIDKTGGIFVRRTDLMPEADRTLLHTVARACIVTERGSLEDHLSRSATERELPPQFIPRRPVTREPQPPAPFFDLNFFNGLGGFSRDGREYVTILSQGQSTPAPWLNVIANADFGFQISETGGGYSWSVNSRENRLTPWSNDAVSDPPSEVIYLRDEDTGATWTATPLPIRESNAYVIKHGQGYTSFSHTSHGIWHELLVFVPVDSPVKISRLRVKNNTTRKRRLSITSYQELVLGTERSASAPFIITEVDQTTQAIFARNPYHNEFSPRIAFADMSEVQRTVTCDRREFIGAHGSMHAPAALRRTRLSGATGGGLDPCMAIQTLLELDPDETREILLLFGEAGSSEEARLIISRYRDGAAVKEAFDRVVIDWDEMLGTVEVSTPDTALNVIVNRWLLYQTLSCRVWARTGFYQSSGAYGFRDQLQDVMALVYAKPDVAREHLLRAAGRQFREGDVQHWWHAPTWRGLRTRISDDPLWLSYVTNFYVTVTGDRAVLNEEVPFLQAAALTANEIESYRRSLIADDKASLFEHCVRAIERCLNVGDHGLPLMGSGDWNDGMNRVGHKGKGESVWLGWFLYKVLDDFAKLCDECGEKERAVRYRAHMEKLQTALEKSWDGDWYLRAFFDDGTPLGSATNDECRIDSIAQSWAVISGAADPQHARHAMAAAEQHLIKRGEGLALLLTPPFDKSSLEPGYIKGYLPGVRENGGQYTHAALWTLIAYAILGDGDRAGELFDLLNPINHGDTRASLHNYRREPYVVAGDVYALAKASGRGGWTWYTGAAAWMYRAALEYILGFKLRGDRLAIEPCMPRTWDGFRLTFRRGKSVYKIRVENPSHVTSGVATLEIDGTLVPLREVALPDDGDTHDIRVVLGEESIAGRAVSATSELVAAGVSR